MRGPMSAVEYEERYQLTSQFIDDGCDGCANGDVKCPVCSPVQFVAGCAGRRSRSASAKLGKAENLEDLEDCMIVPLNGHEWTLLDPWVCWGTLGCSCTDASYLVPGRSRSTWENG